MLQMELYALIERPPHPPCQVPRVLWPHSGLLRGGIPVALDARRRAQDPRARGGGGQRAPAPTGDAERGGLGISE